MPSHAPLPTIGELVRTGHRAIRGQRLATADDHTGSGYNLILGPSAILWRQQAQRDRDLFRTVYDDTATGQDLTDRVFAKTGIARILDSYGLGVAILARPSASAGAGTIFAGSRLQVQGSGVGTAIYVANDSPPGTPVGATDLTATVPIRASKFGAGFAIDSTQGGASGQVLDPLWDTSWTVRSIVCADGTTFEKAADYLARVRTTQRQNRVGFQDAIVTACRNAGAQTVAVFGSGYAGNDYGMNAVYVGDAGFTGSLALVRACILALESARVLGAETHVGPFVPQALVVNATATLNVDPSAVDQLSVKSSLQNACARGFASSGNGFAYARDALGGVMASVQPSVQSIAFALPVADATVMSGAPPVFPQSLTRYSLRPENIALTLSGPS